METVKQGKVLLNLINSYHALCPQIRKDILNALETRIIPALRSQEVLLLLAAPPYDFSGTKHWTIHQELLPDNDKRLLQVIREWPAHQLVATRGSNISFLYAT